MGRHDRNTRHGGPKPQKYRKAGSPQSRARGHHQYRVFGDPPIQPEITPEQQTPTFSYAPKQELVRPGGLRAYRAPIPDDIVAIDKFLKDTGGRLTISSKSGIKFTSIHPNVMAQINSKFSPELARILLDDYLIQHAGTIAFGVEELNSFRGNRDEVIMKAKATDETIGALNNDISDLYPTFGVTDFPPPTSLIVGIYPNKDAYNDATTALTEILQRQGGVLLTFGGVELP